MCKTCGMYLIWNINVHELRTAALTDFNASNTYTFVLHYLLLNIAFNENAYSLISMWKTQRFNIMFSRTDRALWVMETICFYTI